jgi:3-hydroxybutyryl-CoA dehydrogenase
LEQKDIGGLEIHADAQRSIVPALEHSGVPNRYVQEMVKRGENGIVSGLGFYDWRGVDRRRAAQDASPPARATARLPAIARAPRRGNRAQAAQG